MLLDSCSKKYKVYGKVWSNDLNLPIFYQSTSTIFCCFLHVNPIQKYQRYTEPPSVSAVASGKPHSEATCPVYRVNEAHQAMVQVVLLLSIMCTPSIFWRKNMDWYVLLFYNDLLKVTMSLTFMQGSSKRKPNKYIQIPPVGIKFLLELHQHCGLWLVNDSDSSSKRFWKVISAAWVTKCTGTTA